MAGAQSGRRKLPVKARDVDVTPRIQREEGKFVDRGEAGPAGRPTGGR